MNFSEIEKRVSFHLEAIEQGKRSIVWLAKEALRTPELRKMPGAEAIQLLMNWGLAEGEARTLIVMSLRQRLELARDRTRQARDPG
jgi:hypothetical protein